MLSSYSKAWKQPGRFNQICWRQPSCMMWAKTLHPLSIFDRVIIVLGKRLFPRRVMRWAEGAPKGLCLPFVVAEHHAQWGAELAADAGATPLTVELIRRHQEPPFPASSSQTEQLLAALQAADDEN